MNYRSVLVAVASVAFVATGTFAQIAADWRTAALSAGAWSYRAVPTGSEAVFTDTGGTRRMVVRCASATRRVGLSVTSQAPASSIVVSASESERTLPARFDAQGFQIVADLAAQDPLLDALAMSRGRFAVAVPAGVTLVLPAWPEFARSIEDCRL